MSASAAKVSKKELNSNHDGADETSGKKGEWRPSLLCFTAIFSTFFFLKTELALPTLLPLPLIVCVVFYLLLNAHLLCGSARSVLLRVFTV